CQRALALGACSYKSLESILRQGLEKLPLSQQNLPLLRVSESIFLPEQGQSDAGTAQLGMDMSPVRHRTLITG
ncbi:hypothetical protein, partial [Pseudomonas syringae]|uniref:hypothetical protein n=1 Tax=Pseudomonas syringae TaxID=317 RepID=UPI0024466FCA